MLFPRLEENASIDERLIQIWLLKLRCLLGASEKIDALRARSLVDVEWLRTFKQTAYGNVLEMLFKRIRSQAFQIKVCYYGIVLSLCPRDFKGKGNADFSGKTVLLG
ncbi:unnamed protein product [Protopolystoma xenopodis]|uniref:Uncharacterized protein n=1 Tax=Protopolystoma xenopodis TaxID=117903 RepID=A0A448X9L6_9PLAT|nr:unnamed protein product [Protopolystoma xenopodis]